MTSPYGNHGMFLKVNYVIPAIPNEVIADRNAEHYQYVGKKDS